ncbi:SIMPL domain-containing protein [Stenotrophomonas sp. PS02289]|uniref:SIMPL domain-containing protein n=1 Tax=Stenotrophomonas sp. PS02289 TaxID=2991422 RepID=UPI00249AC46D|nr:SIMPL domain-containing protein [Stenotrophomonas sp. PS02289]
MKLLNALLLSSTLAVMAGPAWAQANAIPSQPHLLVKGTASRTVMPDRFTVKVELESIDMQTDVARRRVQANAERVLQLFAQHGAIEGSVRADNLSIAPSTRYRDGDEVFNGTAVSRDLKAEFADAQSLQAMLAELKATREVQVRTSAATYSGEGRLRAELKAQAAAQTRESAKGLAGAYGAKITGLYSISDVAPNFAYGVQAGTWGAASSSGDGYGYSGDNSLDRVQVTGSRGRSAAAPGELLAAAPITYTENVYAIFLIQDGP